MPKDLFLHNFEKGTNKNGKRIILFGIYLFTYICLHIFVYIYLLSDSSKILNNEQLDNGINLKSKPIMQKNSLFPKNEMGHNI